MIVKPRKEKARAFKFKKFSKDASKANIADAELARAIQEVMQGKVIDLGGGVYKKRLNKNDHRSIVLAKSNKVWVFAHLYAKKNKDNIIEAELKAFRKTAAAYGSLSPLQLQTLIDEKELQEIYYGNEEI